MVEIYEGDEINPCTMEKFVLLTDYEALKAENEALKNAVTAVSELIQDSDGVAGLHMNGNVAPWESLLSGGFMSQQLDLLEHNEYRNLLREFKTANVLRFNYGKPDKAIGSMTKSLRINFAARRHEIARCRAKSCIKVIRELRELLLETSAN